MSSSVADAAPLIGVAILAVVFFVFKAEEKRITEED